MNAVMRARSPSGRVLPGAGGLIVVAALLLVTGSVAAQDPNTVVVLRNFTPAAWHLDPVPWIGDADGNGIDDAIEEPEPQIPPGQDGLIVNMRRCMTPDELEALLQRVGLTDPGIEAQQLGHLTSLLIVGIDPGLLLTYAQAIVGDPVIGPQVAFVERQRFYTPILDVSVPSICVTDDPGSTCTGSVELNFPGLDGGGVNIVIMDTGVDDTHACLSPGRFVGGYDAFTRTYGNPVDTNGHGTHVASIALGHAAMPLDRGVAPMSGLIDVKTIPGTTAQVLDALDKTYDKRGEWGVRVINMSFGRHDGNDDGLDALSQLVDLGAARGIIMVAAVGNDGPTNSGVSAPASATRAITVGAAEDNATTARGNDTLAWYSSRGPRAGDGDHCTNDELKPDVAAPGTMIMAALANSVNQGTVKSGTSMAAPHVSGTAALLMQQSWNNNRGTLRSESLKDLLIRSAWNIDDPLLANDPNQVNWDSGWGWGYINAYQACQTAEDGSFDVTFRNHPYATSWISTDIFVGASPPTAGEQTWIDVYVRNNGSVTAEDVRINFGDATLTPTIVAFYDIGTRIVDLPPGVSKVRMRWTPQYTGHRCIWVEIGYGPDTNYRNNWALKNYAVAQSPVTFEARNIYTLSEAEITFVGTIVDANTPGWTIDISPESVSLDPVDCPVDVQVELIPPARAPQGETALADVAARIDGTEVGGVRIQETKDQPGCTPDCDAGAGDADVDEDCDVDLSDLATVLANFGRTEAAHREGDSNHDGNVDLTDLANVLSLFGATCAP